MDPPGSYVPQGPPLDAPEAQYTPGPHHSLSRANGSGHYFRLPLLPPYPTTPLKSRETEGLADNASVWRFRVLLCKFNLHSSGRIPIHEQLRVLGGSFIPRAAAVGRGRGVDMLVFFRTQHPYCPSLPAR
jgi:hypothetical protein